MGKTIKLEVRMPATSANLGPGFDCLGLAFQLYGRFLFTIQTGQSLEPGDPDMFGKNLTLEGYQTYGRALDVPLAKTSVYIQSDIPSTRGLGSSSACAGAGLIAASLVHHFLEDGKFYKLKLATRHIMKKVMTPDQVSTLLELGTRMEGHPDNIAPCLLGGLRLSGMGDQGVVTARLPLRSKLNFVVFIPDFTMRTAQARKSLPASYSKSDTVSNLSSLAFLLDGLRTGREDELALGLQDRVHQPYRFPLIKGGDKVRDLANQAGAIGTVISGAGPSLISVLPGGVDPKQFVQKVTPSLPRGWSARYLPINRDGASFKILA